MKVDADEFMKTHSVRKRVSVLEPFKDEILKLKYAGYSNRQIIEFLSLNGVVISQNALNSFIKARQKSEFKEMKKDVDSTTEMNSSSTLTGKALAPCEHVHEKPQDVSNDKRELVEVDGRVVDVNYKPSWVDDDINLKDLL